MGNPKRLGSALYTEAGPFEHFNVLRKDHQMTVEQFSTRKHITMESMSSALDSVQSPSGYML